VFEIDADLVNVGNKTFSTLASINGTEDSEESEDLKECALTSSLEWDANDIYLLNEKINNSLLNCLDETLLIKCFSFNFYFRVESYSCKMSRNYKKLYKIMHAEPGTSPNDLQALSPPQSMISQSHSPHQHR